MAKRFVVKRLVLLLSLSGLVSIHHPVMASAFQLWELDAVSVGDYHAGHAAIADDASTSFTNPAGLIRIKNQEIIAGGSAIYTRFKVNGNVQVNNTFNDIIGTPQSAIAQGGGFNFVPFGHYAFPVNNKLTLGLSILVPFGLQTNYGDKSAIRYSAMLSSIKVIDYAPAMGVAVNQRLSLGLGLDVQQMNGEFTQMTTSDASTQDTDTLSHNKGSDTAYGYHWGVLYQFSPKTRAGLTYHSQVVHHLTGDSTYTGFLAEAFDVLPSDQLSVKIALPPITSVSLFHEFNPKWDMMASISYIQWNVIQDLILNNTAGILANEGTNTLPVVIHAGYHNTWNYTVGANYHVNSQWLFRAGLGYDQTPTTNQYRNLQLPDSDRIALAIGAHFQMNKKFGLDAGWTHIIAMNTAIHHVPQTLGDEMVVTNGNISANANVYALQLRWDIA